MESVEIESRKETKNAIMLLKQQTLLQNKDA